MRHRREASDDQGETLLELIVSIAILGICVIAVGSGIALSIRISAVHRSQATASALLHNYAESLQARYAPCSGATPPNYVSLASLPTPTGFVAPTATVRFWDPTSTSFAIAACPSSDPGLQQVTLNLTSSGGSVSESLVVVLRTAS